MPTATTADRPRSHLQKYGGLAVSLAAVAAVALIGGLVTDANTDSWYRTLEKPSFNPPGWVFGPVWTVLYVMMAVAAWLVWLRAGWARGRSALLLHAGQLALNLAWSLLFFGAHAIVAALIEILGLLALILLTARAFHRIEPVAGWLMLPYAAWVAFATLLNGAIVALN